MYFTNQNMSLDGRGLTGGLRCYLAGACDSESDKQAQLVYSWSMFGLCSVPAWPDLPGTVSGSYTTCTGTHWCSTWSPQRKYNLIFTVMIYHHHNGYVFLKAVTTHYTTPTDNKHSDGLFIERLSTQYHRNSCWRYVEKHYINNP